MKLQYFRGKAVIKIGGSLIDPAEGDHLERLCQGLEALAQDFQLIIIAGGGQLAELIRDYDRRFKMSQQSANRAAILAMEQNTLLLENLFFRFKKVNDPEEIGEEKGICLFYPAAYLFQTDPLPNSWEITSDSISLYLASKMTIPNLILCKSIPGINHKFGEGGLFENISNESNNIGIVDEMFLELFLQYKKELPELVCWLLDGKDTAGVIKTLTIIS